MKRTLVRSAVISVATLAFSSTALIVPSLGALADAACFDPTGEGAAARGHDNARAGDHRDVSAAEQRAIEKRTKAILAARGRAKPQPPGDLTMRHEGLSAGEFRVIKKGAALAGDPSISSDHTHAVRTRDSL